MESEGNLSTYERVQLSLQTLRLDKRQQEAVNKSLQLAYLTGLAAGIEAGKIRGANEALHITGR